MKKIIVKVCMGTTCFVYDSENLQKLTEIVEQKYKDKVEVAASPCLGVCSTNWAHSRAPYMKVDDEIVQEASVEKVLEVIDRHIASGKTFE